MAKRQLPNVVRTTWAATVGLSALVTIAGFAVPTLRSILEQIAWPWGWVVAAILLPIAVGSIGQVHAQSQALSEPDPKDVEMYASFRALLPSTQGTVEFLETFNGKVWSDAQLAPLEDAARHWQHWTFSNKKVGEAFDAFYRAQADFINWSSFHGFTDDAGRGIGWYTIDFKPGSKPSEIVRHDGLAKAKLLRSSIIEFERIGRREGLSSA